MSYLIAIIAVLLLGRSVVLRSRSARLELLHARQQGLFRLELRRKAELVVHADGCGGVCFPTPRETRSLALVLGCFQVWAKTESVALPAVFQDVIDSVQARDCDLYFPSCFCSIEAGASRSLFHALA